MEQFRQGDVLVEYASREIPKDAKPIAREGGAVVLAHGEATGHAHKITGRGVKFFQADAGQRFLSVTAPKSLEHDEHDTIPLPRGNPEVIRQREYSPEAIRNVAD